MNHERRNFDEAATTWDEKPERVRLANAVADAILREVPVTAKMNALDFGCGTGLLTLRLQPLVRTIIGADSSRGMLDILNAKIAAAGLDNICSMYVDPDRDEPLKGKYHLIVSSMTLHHVKRIEPLLAHIHAALVPGGLLCLADLDSDEGRFHDDTTGVFHFGFDRAALRTALHTAGFSAVRDLTGAEVVKSTKDGSSHRFSVFLMIAHKEPAA